MSKMTITALAAAAALSACSFIPAYEAPQVNIPASFPHDAAAPQGDAASVPVAAVGWRDWFADPRLHRLIELALDCNTDLRQAALNAEAVQKQYAITRASLFPSLDASASGSRAAIFSRRPGTSNGHTIVSPGLTTS